MFIVEYLASSMIEPKKFIYEMCEENYQTNEIEYINNTSGQVLTLNKNRYEYTLTRPYICEN